MAHITCRFTFIDVLLDDEERAKDMYRGRARSEPPRPWSDMVHMDKDELPARTRPTDREDSAESLNQGSRGHPELCKRPCVHMAKKGPCPGGSGCGYCHLPHRPARRPLEEERALMRRLPKSEPGIGSRMSLKKGF